MLRIWFEITDEKAETFPHVVVPYHGAGYTAAYRLTKYEPDRRNVLAKYFASLSPDGTVFCSCQGFAAKKTCRHLAALDAAGMMPVHTLIYLEGLRLELEHKTGRV